METQSTGATATPAVADAAPATISAPVAPAAPAAEPAAVTSTPATDTAGTPAPAVVPDPIAKPEEERTQIDARRFAALAKEEKKIRLERETLKKDREEIQATRAEIDAAKANPLGFLEKLGWNYNKLTEFVLNDQKPTASHEVESVRKELHEHQKALAEKEKAEAERVFDSTVASYKQTVGKFLDDNAEKYPLLRKRGGANSVYIAVKAHHDETGKLLTFEEVADLAEESLSEEVTSLAELAAATPKLRSIFEKHLAPKAPAVGTQVPAAPESVVGPNVNPGPKTLTNADASATPPKELPKKGKLLSRDESIAEAARLLERLEREAT